MFNFPVASSSMIQDFMGRIALPQPPQMPQSPIQGYNKPIDPIQHQKPFQQPIMENNPMVGGQPQMASQGVTDAFRGILPQMAQNNGFMPQPSPYMSQGTPQQMFQGMGFAGGIFPQLAQQAQNNHPWMRFGNPFGQAFSSQPNWMMR